jgi:hypothetical protein
MWKCFSRIFSGGQRPSVPIRIFVSRPSAPPSTSRYLARGPTLISMRPAPSLASKPLRDSRTLRLCSPVSVKVDAAGNFNLPTDIPHIGIGQHPDKVTVIKRAPTRFGKKRAWPLTQQPVEDASPLLCRTSDGNLPPEQKQVLAAKAAPVRLDEPLKSSLKPVSEAYSSKLYRSAVWTASGQQPNRGADHIRKPQLSS